MALISTIVGAAAVLLANFDLTDGDTDLTGWACKRIGAPTVSTVEHAAQKC